MIKTRLEVHFQPCFSLISQQYAQLSLIKKKEEGRNTLIIRRAKQTEISLLFEQGYKEWSKNRSFEHYCNDNSKEDRFGTRYVIEINSEIVSSTIVLELQRINGRKAYGIGSVLTPQNHRGNGYAAKLISQCINLVYEDNSIIFLYSDISPTFYEKLNFKLLPLQLQRYNTPCMAYCNDEVWNELLYSKIDLIPHYF